MPSAKADAKPIKLTPSMELYQEVWPAVMGLADTAMARSRASRFAMNYAGEIEMTGIATTGRGP